MSTPLEPMKSLIFYIVLMLFASNVSGHTVTLTDDLGRAVSIDANGRRWISLAPHLTESFQAVGLDDRLIAVDQYSPHTGRLANVHRISGLMPHQATLFRWSPTVVWAWYTSPSSRLLALERQGVPVFYSRPQSLDSIPAFIEKLKQLVHDEAQVKKVQQQWYQRIENLRTHYANVRVIHVFHPFSWRPLLSFNRKHWLSDALKLCGAVSVTDSLALAEPLVKPAYVLEQHTDVLLIAEKEPLAELKKMWSQAVPVLATIPIIQVDPDRWHRPSPRFIEGLEVVCAKIDEVRNLRKTQ